MANTSNRSPPAILKSYISIPSTEKTNFPRARKPTLTERAVMTDWFIIFVFCGFSIPSTRDIKMGNMPTTSIAIKRGIKASRKLCQCSMCRICSSFMIRKNPSYHRERRDRRGFLAIKIMYSFFTFGLFSEHSVTSAVNYNISVTLCFFILL